MDTATHDHVRMTPVSMLLPPDLLEAVDEHAGRELLTRSAWIRRFLYQGLVGSTPPSEAA